MRRDENLWVPLSSYIAWNFYNVQAYNRPRDCRLSASWGNNQESPRKSANITASKYWKAYAGPVIRPPLSQQSKASQTPINIISCLGMYMLCINIYTYIMYIHTYKTYIHDIGGGLFPALAEVRNGCFYASFWDHQGNILYICYVHNICVYTNIYLKHVRMYVFCADVVCFAFLIYVKDKTYLAKPKKKCCWKLWHLIKFRSLIFTICFIL